MKQFCIKLIITSIIICTLNFIPTKVFAKYIINHSETIIKIEKADNQAPTINNRNYDVDYEIFSSNLIINYEDNIKVKSAVYWMNPDEKQFQGEGTGFISGTEFGESGWYKILVEDLYSNKTSYIFLLDKEVNRAEIFATDADDSGSSFTFTAFDKLIGIAQIDVFVDNKVYKTYNYEEQFVFEHTEILEVPVQDLPFFEEAYIVAKDFLGNTIKSNVVIPNTSRICTLRDLCKFRDVVNNDLNTFNQKSIYLLNDIDMKEACNNDIGSWGSVGSKDNMFSGHFYGNGHILSNFYINNVRDDRGLFGVNNGTISDLNLEGVVYGNSGDNRGGVAGINYGTIENCNVDVEVFGYGNNQGGIVGVNSGTIQNCLSHKKVTCISYAGGISGYNKNGYIYKCANTAEIISIKGFTGGISGFSESLESREFVIENCYNTGRIISDNYAGGICGAAWDNENKTIGIRFCYNTGEIKPYINPDIIGNGGILGGTYFDYSGKKVQNINKIMYCYNIGNMQNIKDGKINQIVSSYSDISSCYYISGKTNTSGYGIPKEESLFRALISNTNSVIYLLEKEVPNMWTINSNYNNGYLSLSWQVK